MYPLTEFPNCMSQSNTPSESLIAIYSLSGDTGARGAQEHDSGGVGNRWFERGSGTHSADLTEPKVRPRGVRRAGLTRP
jgi:hypothetical protein